MSDRVPIGTHPGSVSELVNQDLVLMPAATESYTIEKVWLRNTDSATDALVAAIRNATAGGGDGLAITVADAAYSGVSSAAAITIDVGESVYLRVTSANALRQNLSGWFETETLPPSVVTALTNLPRVKRFWGISAGTNDTLLNELIASVSEEIQAWLDRRIVQATETNEKPPAPLGESGLWLYHRPIISIGSITEAGTVLVEDTDFECTARDKAAGRLIRLSGGYPSAWNSSSRRIVVTYNHGYATIPEGLAQAATELVVFDYLQSQPSQKRLALRGKILEPGGSVEYLTRRECWDAQRTRLAPHRRM